eukprot:510503-Pyramimonas_sp.AAC.1
MATLGLVTSQKALSDCLFVLLVDSRCVNMDREDSSTDLRAVLNAPPEHTRRPEPALARGCSHAHSAQSDYPETRQ